MRTRSGCWMPPVAKACSGGSPSLQTPSSSARRSSGWCDSRTSSPRLVIEGGVEEEALVGEPEGLAGLADAALAQGYQLLAFGESADGDRPFFESNWHRKDEDEAERSKECLGKTSGSDTRPKRPNDKPYP